MARPAHTYRAARRNALRTGAQAGFPPAALAWWRSRPIAQRHVHSDRAARRAQRRAS